MRKKSKSTVEYVEYVEYVELAKGATSSLGNVRLHAESLKKTDTLAAERFLCQWDLKYLCVEVLGYRDWDIVHDRVVDFMWGSGQKFKLMMLARGHLKSSIVTIGYTIQRLLRKPDIRVLISNVKWGNAKNFLHQIKQFLTQDKLVELFGDFKDKKQYSSGWNSENIIIAQRDRPHPEPSVMTCGVESEQTSQHYDLIVHDDIVARDNIGTMDQIEKVKNYYRDSLSLLEPDGEMILIGTTWSDTDLYSELRDDDEYDKLILPAYTERVISHGAIRREILFPKKFSYELLMKLKKRIGPYQFHSQYMLNPYPDEAQEFKKSWLQYYTDLPSGEYYISTTLDPSLGKKTSNWAGTTTTAIDINGNIFVEEARHFRRMVDLIPHEVLQTALKYKPHVFGLERFAFQQILEGPIRRIFEENNLQTSVQLLPYSSQDKNTRIQGLIPSFANGKVFIKESQKDLIDELMRFNPSRKNACDDIIDSLAWHTVFWSRKPEINRTIEVKEGSFNWWLGRSRAKTDIFWDFRGAESPAIV